MNEALIVRTANPITLVYVGKECLFVYPTNQEAWEHMRGLIAVSDQEDDWPQEIYMVLALADRTGVRCPQIAHITAKENELEHRELFGAEFTEFNARVIRDWPTIQESADVSSLLYI